MSTRTLPDLEGAVIDYLLQSDDVAALVDDRIFTDVPNQTPFPYITVEKISERDTRHWFSLATVRVFGWANRGQAGSPRDTAYDVCETATAALHDAANYSDGITVLGACTVLIGVRRQDDQATSNPRFVADVLVPYHPAPAAS